MSRRAPNEPIPGMVAKHTLAVRGRTAGVKPVAYGTAGVLGLVAVLYACSGSGSAHDRYCVDAQGRRVIQSACSDADDDGTSGGGGGGGGGTTGARWYYVPSGSTVPTIGDRVTGGSFDVPSRGGFGFHGSGGS